MSTLARLILARPGLVAAAALATVVAAGIVGGGVTERLSTGGNVVPGSDSAVATELLDEIDAGAPNLVVLITEAPVLGAAAAGAADRVAGELEALDGVSITGSAWGPDGGAPAGPLVADDGASGLVTAHIEGDDAAVQATSQVVVDRLRVDDWPDGVAVEVGGLGPTRLDLIATTDRDLLRAELLALPISLLLLLYFFRTPVAAALTLVVAAVAVIGTLAALRLLVAVTEVSIFARSVTTVLGLAMAIDMTLFLVGRYRECRPDAPDPRTAVGRALEAAGPSILFSGLTTATSLGALLLFSPPLLRSFAYGGAVVVLLALVGSLVVLPAVMALLGDRIDRWPVRSAPVEGTGRWHRLARAVMARPWLIGGGAVLALILVASPISRIELGVNDDRVLPTSVESRRVTDEIRTRFAGLEGGTISVVFTGSGVGAVGGDGGRTAPVPEADLAAYVDRLAALDGVVRVDRDPDRPVLSIIPSVEPISNEGRRLVGEIRAVPAPAPVVVGGEAARLTDNVDHVVGRLPWVVAVVMLAMAALLALAFRSVVVPLKALVLNALSLSAMFGAVVWVFQDGRFTGLLGYTPTGLTDVTVPALMFAVAFGLSMDYEVYLLARIRESFVATGDPVDSTAVGLERTGRILTASAVLMAVVFGSFVTASVTHIKMLGLGIALAVLVDAFVVRTLVVPSFMAIAGRANWWPTTGPARPTDDGDGDEADLSPGPDRATAGRAR